MAVSFINALFSAFLLVFLPILASLIIVSPYFPQNVVKIRRFAKGFNSIYLAYTALFTALVNPEGAGFAFCSKLPFNLLPDLNLTLSFSLDNVSALICVLVSLVILLSLMMSKTLINSKHKFFYSLLLALEGAAIGVFAADNLFTFALFFLLATVPVYFLVSVWGGNAAKKSAEKYVISAALASVLLLIATGLTTAYCADLGLTSSFEELIAINDTIPLLLALVSSIGFFFAFAINLPVFPFHSALTSIKSEAPIPVSMALCTIPAAISAYGLIRINLQIFCTMTQILAPAFIFLGAIGVVWSAFAALKQSSIKRLLAFLSNAFCGIILIGLLSFTEFGLKGGIAALIATSLTFCGLYAGCGIISNKFKTDKLAFLGGISTVMPLFATLMFILCAAVASIPLTFNFFAVFLSIAGAYASPIAEKSYFMTDWIQASAILALFGLFLCAATILKFFGKAFLGICDVKFLNAKGTDYTLLNHQKAVLIIATAAIILFGFYPMGILDKISTFSSINIAIMLSSIF